MVLLGLMTAILPLPVVAGGLDGGSINDWPNVLDPLEAWMFDLGSQVGFRAASASAHAYLAQQLAGGRTLLTVEITGPAPDWAIPAGSRPANLTASSARDEVAAAASPEPGLVFEIDFIAKS